MAIEIPPLPWAEGALAPHLSAETLSFHYGKHHRTYVDKLNGLIAGGPLAHKSLEDIVRGSDGDTFHNAAQVWNHTFYWNSMKPGGGGAPRGAIADAIQQDFGGYDKFRAAFVDAATTLFGSGWAWLVLDGGKLSVTMTPDADTPLTGKAKPILTIDVWEHAYYIDYRNARPKYVDAFLDHLVNWDFANSRL